jgi:hypothetical protein
MPCAPAHPSWRETPTQSHWHVRIILSGFEILHGAFSKTIYDLNKPDRSFMTQIERLVCEAHDVETADIQTTKGHSV